MLKESKQTVMSETLCHDDVEVAMVATCVLETVFALCTNLFTQTAVLR